MYAKIYLFTYALFVATMFVLPLFSFEGYTITKNTISELGAQKTSGNWFANLAVILLSFAVVFLGTKQLRPFWKQLAALYFFSVCFFLTGVYQLAGLDAHTYIFNYTDDALHSLFYMLTSFAFCLFCFTFIFIVEKRNHKWQTFVALALSLILPLLIFLYPEYRGIHQRILFLGAFGWLFYAFALYTFKKQVSTTSRMKRYKKQKK